MRNQRTRKRIFGIELESRSEAAAVIGLMILFAMAAVVAAIAIEAQTKA